MATVKMPGVGRGNNPNSRATQFKKLGDIAKIPSNKRTPQDRVRLMQTERAVKKVGYNDAARYKKALQRGGLKSAQPKRTANLKQSILTSARRGQIDPSLLKVIKGMDNAILNEMFSIIPRRMEAVYKYPQASDDDVNSPTYGADLPVENTAQVQKFIESYRAYEKVRRQYARTM